MYIKRIYILPIIAFVFISFALNMMAKDQVLYPHKLKTKQAIENIRYIEKDGKFTYFQNKSGELFLSKNFSNKVLMKDTPNTQYTLSSTPSRKKILLVKDNKFYSFLSVYKNNDIYAINYGTTDTIKIGQGLSPQLHLNDQWVSYYDIETRFIKIFNISNPGKVYKIVIKAPDIARHIPHVEMIDETQIIYTDLNENFQSRLNAHYLQTNQSELIYQSEQTTAFLDICMLKEKVYISQVSKTDQEYSQILVINPENSPTLKKFDVLYNQSSKDLGHITCHQEYIYFFKQRENQKNLHIPDQDLFSINIESKKLQQQTSQLAIENLFILDGRLISVLAGDFYQMLPEKSIRQDKKNQSSKQDRSFFGDDK